MLSCRRWPLSSAGQEIARLNGTSRSRNSEVGVASGLRTVRLRRCGSIPGKVKWSMSCPRSQYQLCGSGSIIYNGYRPFFPWIKRPERETSHSPPFHADVNACRYTSTFPHAIMCVLYMDNVNFYRTRRFIRAAVFTNILICVDDEETSWTGSSTSKRHWWSVTESRFQSLGLVDESLQ